MKAHDPFAAITQHCHVSSSQEEPLRHCRFAGEEPEESERVKESGESPEAPVESTGIMMMSPPESSEHSGKNGDNTPKENDVFQTPPEGSQQISGSDDQRNDRTVVVEKEIVVCCTEGETAVDLGADTDLGFSELELTQRFETLSEVIHSKLNKVRALKRELGIRECLSEIPYKNSKFSDKNPFSESPNRCLRENLNYNKDSPYSCGCKSPQSNQNSEASGESSAKRKLQFSTEVLDLEAEASHRGSEFNEGDREVCNNGNGKGSSNSGPKSIEEIDKYRYVGPGACNSSETERTQAIHALPVSICGPREKDGGKELDSDNHCGEITLLDMLRMLARKCDYDRSLESRSILDVAKSRGMTFP